jgi:hypothetical protein
MSKQRTHLSNNQVITLYEVKATETTEAGAFKPAGFWYEVNGEWQRCEANLWSYRYIHKVTLNDCDVLVVDTLNTLDAFHAEYSVCNMPCGVRGIDWERVAARFDGLEIAPYQYRRRLDFIWYYPWDCASGVIWRPKNAAITYIGEYRACD